jgi:hypothetical protein
MQQVAGKILRPQDLARADKPRIVPPQVLPVHNRPPGLWMTRLDVTRDVVSTVGVNRATESGSTKISASSARNVITRLRISDSRPFDKLRPDSSVREAPLFCCRQRDQKPAAPGLRCVKVERVPRSRKVLVFRERISTTICATGVGQTMAQRDPSSRTSVPVISHYGWTIPSAPIAPVFSTHPEIKTDGSSR